MEVSYRRLNKKKKLVNIPVALKRFFAYCMYGGQSKYSVWPEFFKQRMETILHMWYYAFLHDEELLLKNLIREL